MITKILTFILKTKKGVEYFNSEISLEIKIDIHSEVLNTKIECAEHIIIPKLQEPIHRYPYTGTGHDSDINKMENHVVI